jgi:hypothetical protein
MGRPFVPSSVFRDGVAAGSTRSWSGVVVDNENPRSVSACSKIGCDFGATAIDTEMASATPASPEATIGSADYGRNRMGMK